MPELIIWKNQQIDKIRRDMDRMFDKMWGEFGLSAFPRQFKEFPPIEVKETIDDLIFNVEIPGYQPKDIEISVTEDNLILKGSIKHKSIRNAKGHIETEHRQSSFSKTLRLPRRIIVDDVKASYKDGILRITMPKYKGEKKRALEIED